MDLNKLTAHELGEMLDKKEISSTEITKSVLQEIENKKELNGYISVFADSALENAKKFDNEFSKSGKRTPLAGIPISIKDNINIKNKKTTCGSHILENFISPYNATVIDKLQNAGCIIIGKTNMDEFAMGSSTENSYFGTSKNPNNEEYIPGGSSGGSAVSVAADQTIISIGSDTGGSIRQPASLCGVVGLKPTYGRVSRYGLVAFASSLDQIGPITKDVKDAALLLQVISGYDNKDSTCINESVPDYSEMLKKDLEELKIGIPKEYFIEGIDPNVKSSIDEALKKLQNSGIKIEEVSLPHTEYAVTTYYLIAPAEASSNLARYDGVKYGFRKIDNDDNLIDMYRNTRCEGFGKEVKRRIIIGTYALSAGYYDAYYMKALKVRNLIKQDFDNVFKKVDIIAAPVTPAPAFKIGEKINDPLQMYLLDIFTTPANLAGIPGISVPCSKTENNLPIGIQFLAPPLKEDLILTVADYFENLNKD